MNAAPGSFTALILAGSRGPDDPVARQAGQQHKAFVPVDGVPMLLRVVRTLCASRAVGRIVVCLEDPASLAAVPELAALVAEGRLGTVPAGASPSRSVALALATIDSPFPLLATTADHPLLTPAMVEYFCAAAPAEADVAAALVPAAVVRAAYPDALRTFYRFGGEGYSGCNLFALRTPASARAAAFWSRMESHRKRPWRLVAAIGPLVLARFLLGRLSLEAAARCLSERMGVVAKVVLMPFAEATVDVDKPADLALAEAILRGRGA